MRHDENYNGEGIDWLFYAPQFHVAIAIVALTCLGFTVTIWNKVRK